MNKKTHIRNVIAGNVKKYRKLRQLTQENLAELADVSNTYIANIECGQTWISDKTVEKIATALHIEEYMLFIPDEEIISDSDNITKKQKMIECNKKISLMVLPPPCEKANGSASIFQGITV